jgi:nitrite reductase/ring-hydroxylating ferredoxin subunit/uncharacterized membrane protein
MSADAASAHTPPPPGAPAAHRLATQIGQIEALDAPAKAIAAKWRELIGPGPLKDALSGTWLGHALHPLLTDVPIGTWTSATVLDLIGGEDSAPAAQKLIGVGLAAAAPTAVSGWLDWADTEMAEPEVRRMGIVHAVSNVAAITLYSASLTARLRGNRGRGKLLGLAGAAALGAGGFLGGHLSYAKGVGVDNTTFESAAADWTDALADGDLAEGSAQRVEVEGVPIMVTRQNGTLYALADRCSHRGGPLSDGEIADGCVECPWHHTKFRLEDGSVAQGPAAYPQPAYAVRTREGRIEVKAAA